MADELILRAKRWCKVSYPGAGRTGEPSLCLRSWCSHSPDELLSMETQVPCHQNFLFSNKSKKSKLLYETCWVINISNEIQIIFKTRWPNEIFLQVDTQVKSFWSQYFYLREKSVYIGDKVRKSNYGCGDGGGWERLRECEPHHLSHITPRQTDTDPDRQMCHRGCSSHTRTDIPTQVQSIHGMATSTRSLGRTNTGRGWNDFQQWRKKMQ